MAEFNAEVMGIYVVISTKDPENKLVKDYNSLLILEEVDEENKIIKIRPNIDDKMFINK
jgi:purine operon repressor